MTKDFNYITSRGLPGGPNQEITYVTGVFSVEGYRYDSPDKNNSVNLIESGNISMSENDGSPLKKGPLLGIDNLGNKEVMIPGTNYSFPGDQVLEIPMAKSGGSVSWDWKGKSYSGTLIPSMETESNRYARTNNGKIKTLPKAQDGGCASCTESMRQREGSYNKGREYILDPRFKQEGGSTTNPYTIYMNYINGIDESEVAQNIFDKLNRMHYKDAKERGMGVSNYIVTNVIPNS